MKPEQRLWNKLQPIFTGMRLDAHRVENVSRGGMPDVNYKLGWIELKHLDDWPVRASTPVKIPSFVRKKDQATWLFRRWAAGGLCWVLVRVNRQLFLFPGCDAQDVRHGLTRAEFLDRALWWSGPNGQMTAEHRGDLDALLCEKPDHMLPPLRARFHRLRACVPLVSVAEDLNWSLERVVAAERRNSLDTDDLLAYWEN